MSNMKRREFITLTVWSPASARVNGGIKRVKWWPGVRGLRLMGCVKLATQPSRIDSLTA
jgi:hypothetical protein